MWKDLSNAAQKQQANLDRLLSQYSSFQSSDMKDETANSSIDSLENSITQALNELESLILQLNDLEGENQNTHGLPQRALQRHSLAYQEYQNAFKRYNVNTKKKKF
ncbi:hypothetical protein AYI69_g8704 [Smittium culicis]|uniref:Golgi SNAP receptor complex member 1 n=1 Tax=Smittium culicis TaxID=133412 RepID=A0A1R1XHR9_9FUNG|nr:hypothetical protein AYI69_g8704 [Smittium culicis]